MAEALAGGHDCVVTIGGIQSNHCRATAAAAALLGVDAHLILRCPAKDVDGDPRAFPAVRANFAAQPGIAQFGGAFL